MIANKLFLIGLHLLVTYHLAKTFVILSANIDDVRKLAKELSGPLTDEIVKIILKATKNVSLDSSHENKANGSTSNTIKPKKKKHKHYKKQILRNNFQQVDVQNVQDRNTPKYAYAVSPKIHNFAEVNTEVKTTCTTPVSNKNVLKSYYALPQTADKNSNTLDDNVDNDLDDLNNAANNPTTKKRDTEGIRTTKLIEYYSNSQEENLEYHPTKKNKKKKKKKSKTMETLETLVIANKEVTKSAKKEKTKDKMMKAKPKKQKTTQTTTLTDETTIHETTVDIELQKFENEARGYMQNQFRPRLTSKTTYQKDKSKDTQFESVKNTQSKSKRTKTQTPTTTVSLQKLSKKVEQLNHFAEHLLETSSTLVSKKPTPAYPKHDYIDYKIPSSEFKLSYNPNENVNSEDYSKMYAKFFRNQMTDVDQRSTLDKLTDVIKNIFENRLGSRLMNTNDFNRRLDVPSHNMRALTRSEEDRIYEIIKMMIENRKMVEARSRAYTKLSPYEHEKRSTVHAFNIHKMSPEEKMADVIHKMVDSSLKIQFEKPQISIGALSETLKNKPYDNHGVNNEFKVSDMIQNLIEKKIAEYAKVQTTTKAPHMQCFQTETRGSNGENRPWPSLRPSHEAARPRFETRYTSLPIRFQTQTRPSDVQAKEMELEYQQIKTSSFKLAEETPFKEDFTSKWQHFQHSQPSTIRINQGSTIEIGRQGPISIFIEDKTSDEIKRPVPQVLLLQNTAPTDKPDQLGYFLGNRHIETTYAKVSHWPKQTHGYMMEKITAVDKPTKNTETTTIKNSDIRSSNIGNGGGSNTNGIPNVQVVFFNIPQLEAEEERQKLHENQKNEQRKKEEPEKVKEISMEDVSFEVERQENDKNALRQQIEDEVREKFRKEEKRMEEIKRLEEIRKEELKQIEEEKKIIEEKRIQEQKRLQAVRQEYEQKVLKQKIEDELREKFRKEEEEKRKQEEKRIQEERRQQAEREEKAKKDYRQNIEDEMKEREALDRQWKKELKRKIKAKEMAAAIEALKEEENKKNEAEKKIIDQKIVIMQEKLKRDLEETIELKLKKDTPSTDKSTLNYWEQQWQDDQDLKFRDAYYKYMKLHNATSGQNEKTVNYWGEQWRIDLENKLREKQKEDSEKKTLTHEIKEHTKEPSSTKLASNQSAEDQGKIEEKPIQIVHNLLPRDKLSNKLVGGGGLLKNKKNIASSSAMPKPNPFDARRDDSNSDITTLKLIIRRARNRSDGVTAIQEMSDEHTEKNDDVIKSDTIMKDTEIFWGKSQQSEENNVRINGEPTEKDIEVDRASDVNISENKMKNDDTESEVVIESNEHNILRVKKKKGKLRHKKVKKEKFGVALKGEGKIEDKKVKNKNKKKCDKKQVINEDHGNKDKNDKEHKDKKHKKSRHEKKTSKEEQDKIIHISDENRKNENQNKENKRGKLKTKVHKKIKNKVKIEHDKNDEKEVENLKEHKKVKEEDGNIKEQKHKTKHGKIHKINVEEDEWDIEHRLQEEEIKKSKDKKNKEKVKNKLKLKLDPIKKTSKKRKKVKENHKDDDHSKEKETIHEGDNQSKHKKNKAAKLKTEKPERNIGNKKNNKNEEVKVNKKKEDDDDGAREFDFNLMIGENQNPFIRIPKHKKNKNKSG